VRLFWNDSALIPSGTQWKMGAFLGVQVRQLPGFVESGDSIAWRLTTKIDNFAVQSLDDRWTLRFSIRLLLENPKLPFQNRSMRYEKNVELKDADPNRLALLQLLPLDMGNQRIRASIFGLIATELQAVLRQEVLDPFRRSGINIDE
jgi:hypothetical protein